LKVKSTEAREKYETLFNNVQAVRGSSGQVNSYLDSLKAAMGAGIKPEERADYEVMDKSQFREQAFVGGDSSTAEGQKFVDYINDFRKTTIETINKIPDSLMKEDRKLSLVSSIESRFNTGDENGKVMNRDNRPVEWLNYHYEGFPLVASLTKVTLLQSDIKSTQDEILKAMLQGQMASDLSMTNYTTLLEQPKSAYYQGEKFDGNIVLGRK